MVTLRRWARGAIADNPSVRRCFASDGVAPSMALRCFDDPRIMRVHRRGPRKGSINRAKYSQLRLRMPASGVVRCRPAGAFRNECRPMQARPSLFIVWRMWRSIGCVETGPGQSRDARDRSRFRCSRRAPQLCRLKRNPGRRRSRCRFRKRAGLLAASREERMQGVQSADRRVNVIS